MRAHLCSSPEEYAWSSHITLLRGETGLIDGIEVIRTLKLFADEPRNDLEYLRERYRNYVNWRLRKDAAIAEGREFTDPEPETMAGDKYFSEQFCAFPPLRRAPLKDLRDKAIALLEDIDCDVECGIRFWGKLQTGNRSATVSYPYARP